MSISVHVSRGYRVDGKYLIYVLLCVYTYRQRLPFSCYVHIHIIIFRVYIRMVDTYITGCMHSMYKECHVCCM